MRIRLLWTVALLLCVHSAQAQAKRVYRVRVNVSCDAVDLKNQIESAFAAELRGLRDVEISDSWYDLTMDIVALHTMNQSGIETGYAMSVVEATRPKDGDSLQYVVGHRIALGPHGSALRDHAAQIVADLDVEVLQPVRKAASK
jgi:hypothetical protein